MKDTLKYFDIMFFVKFFVVLAFLHYFHIFYLGVVSPGGSIYSPFLENNLNYIEWITDSIVYSANLLTQIFFGIQPVIEGNTILIKDSASVMVWLPCLGLGISSMWVAFVVTNNISIKKKVLWSIFGLFLIWVINCWRITLLLIALHKDWEQSDYLDHHDMFNIVAYIVIGTLVYFFSKGNKQAASEAIETPEEAVLKL